MRRYDLRNGRGLGLFWGLASLGLLMAQETDIHAWLRVTRQTTRGGQTRREYRYGPEVRDYSRTISITIQVRGMGRRTAAVLEWYFLAKPVQGGDAWIFDQGHEEIVLDPTSMVTLEKESKELTSQVREYVGYGLRSESGHKVEGYIVRLLAGGKVIAAAASSRALEALARDEARLNALKQYSAKVIAEIERRERERQGLPPHREDIVAPRNIGPDSPPAIP